MLTPLFWLALVVAAVDWIASWRQWKQVRYVSKPGTMVLLIAWFSQVGHWQGPLVWFGLALVFSLAGDIFLMLPARFFLFGLAAFLTAHVFYVVGLNVSPLPIRWESLVVLVVVGMAAALVFRNIRRGLLRKQGGGGMLVPVMLYSIVISLMVISALLNFWRPAWPLTAAAFAAGGAVLFYISDSILATNRFVAPVPAGDFWVMLTYHLGQFGLAFGALMAFSQGVA